MSGPGDESPPVRSTLGLHAWEMTPEERERKLARLDRESAKRWAQLDRALGPVRRKPAASGPRRAPSPPRDFNADRARALDRFVDDQARNERYGT